MKHNSDRMPTVHRSKTWLQLGIIVALIAAGLLLLNHWRYGALNSYRSWWPMSQGGHGSMMAYGGSWGMGTGMGIGMFFFWGVIIVAIVLLIPGPLSRMRQPHAPADRSDDALEILKKRYARGEIDKSEFDAKRRDLDA